jgi:hypothetical protein
MKLNRNFIVVIAIGNLIHNEDIKIFGILEIDGVFLLGRILEVRVFGTRLMEGF